MNPVEHLVHALASCVTTSMVYHAAARSIDIETVESLLNGDLDLRGFLGLDPTIRSGYQQIRLKMRIKAKVPTTSCGNSARWGHRFPPVYDSLLKGVPISISAERI